MKQNIVIIIGGVVLFVSAVVLVFMQGSVSNFEECVAAGNPVMEKYPPVCRDARSGHTFTKQVDDYWRYDSIMLMQNKEDGSYACFGCSADDRGRGICVDPAMVMEPVEETVGRYCNSDFTLVTGR